MATLAEISPEGVGLPRRNRRCGVCACCAATAGFEGGLAKRAPPELAFNRLSVAPAGAAGGVLGKGGEGQEG